MYEPKESKGEKENPTGRKEQEGRGGGFIQEGHRAPVSKATHSHGTEDTGCVGCVHSCSETSVSKCFRCAAPPEASLAAARRHEQTRDWFVVKPQSTACHVSLQCHVPHVFLFVTCATKRNRIDCLMRSCTPRHTCSLGTTTAALETSSWRTRRAVNRAARAFRCCSTRLAPLPQRL